MLVHRVDRRTSPSARSGFTLLEILVVVAIIVMLAGVGSYYIMQRLEDAKLNTAKMGVDRVSKAVETYKLNYGEAPESLAVLTQAGQNGGPYLKDEELVDPWNQPYQYDPNGSHQQPPGFKPDVFCHGPQGQVIGNWTHK